MDDKDKDREKMEKKLLKMKVPPHEYLKTVEVQQVEKVCLDRVFKWLSSLGTPPLTFR